MELSTIPGHSECRVYLRGSSDDVAGVNTGPLHTKMYIFQKANNIRVVLGSSNFTVGGMEVNEEANVLLTGAVNEPFFSQIVDYFQFLWGSPSSLLVADNAELLTQYEGLVLEERKQHKEALKKRATLEKQFTNLLDSAKAQEGGIWNSDGAYLLGLIAGGGYLISKNKLKIRYHKGVFHKGKRYEGLIYSPGISNLKLNQAEALRKDVNNIADRIRDYLRRKNSKDSVTVHKQREYDYSILIIFKKSSPIWNAVQSYLRKCKMSRNRIVPILAKNILKASNDNIPMSFIRGYADVRGRITATDREGTVGPLRIAVSFSAGADDFAKDVKALLETRFSFKRINLLLGSSRDRETILRIDPVDLKNAGPLKFFSVNWKDILLNDYANYNLKHYPNRYLESSQLVLNMKRNTSK